VPQDGRTQVLIAGKTLDIRVSIIPTYYGERVVMRLLSHASDAPSLSELGFKEEIVKDIEKLLSYSYGIILVTGPTGSGKSTTLHACMKQIADPHKNLISIEDPVEYKSERVNQIQVNDKVGLSFAIGLRSILRQDPDVVMVGEIRDAETARISTQAALTGHLTLSTLHTNDSISAIARLIDMGVENYLILSTLLGVLAQRLIRVLCPHCKEEANILPEQAELLGLAHGIKVYNGVGCDECNHTGYKGRVAICELFVIDNDIRTFIKDNGTTHQVKQFMKKRGMRMLLDDVADMVASGETSPAEAIRVGVMEI
jgi:general secretion pathway protein E